MSSAPPSRNSRIKLGDSVCQPTALGGMLSYGETITFLYSQVLFCSPVQKFICQVISSFDKKKTLKVPRVKKKKKVEYNYLVSGISPWKGRRFPVLKTARALTFKAHAFLGAQLIIDFTSSRSSTEALRICFHFCTSTPWNRFCSSRISAHSDAVWGSFLPRRSRKALVGRGSQAVSLTQLNPGLPVLCPTH